MFIVCNFTNALFFWAFMPETKRRPLEEMNRLFSETGWFVPRIDMKAFQTELAVTPSQMDEKLGRVHVEDA